MQLLSHIAYFLHLTGASGAKKHSCILPICCPSQSEEDRWQGYKQRRLVCALFSHVVSMKTMVFLFQHLCMILISLFLLNYVTQGACKISRRDTDLINHESPLSGYKVVCYFTNSATLRYVISHYLPENINHTLCTHIVYGFAQLQYSDLFITTHPSWDGYAPVVNNWMAAYKKRGIKMLIALVGWNDSARDSRLANNPSARKTVINRAIHLIETYGFDGLDLNWEYPVCWERNCSKSPDSDKESYAFFAALLPELSAEFKQKGLLLSAAVSPSKKVIDKAYDVPTLVKYLDWIAVMAYDYHGHWDNRTGHVAPLYYHPHDELNYSNANYSINYWISKGAPPKSIVMGIPFYGRSFTIRDPRAGTGLNSPTSAAGDEGGRTMAAGILAHDEICDLVRNRGWTVVKDPEGRMGPYAYKDNQWVSFDDSEMIKRKAQFVRDMGLGGAMIWALDLDDGPIRNKCGCGPNPLLRTMNRVLTNDPRGPLCPIKEGTLPIPVTEPQPSVYYITTASPRPIYIPPSTTPITMTTESNINDTIKIKFRLNLRGTLKVALDGHGND